MKISIPENILTNWYGLVDPGSMKKLTGTSRESKAGMKQLESFRKFL